MLVLHGTSRGWDQGIELARLVAYGYQIIAPSRFGYLRTPLPFYAATAVVETSMRMPLENDLTLKG